MHTHMHTHTHTHVSWEMLGVSRLASSSLSGGAWLCERCGCLPATQASQREALLASVSARRLIHTWFILALHKPRCREPKPGSRDGGTTAAPGLAGQGMDTAMSSLSFILLPVP